MAKILDESPFEDEESTKLAGLTAEEFWKSIACVFYRGSIAVVENELTEILEPEKAIGILLIPQSWDWSTYVLEYDDKWQFISIDVFW